MHFIAFRSSALLLSTLLAAAINAATYYVSPTGNDANNGTSQATPWRTIARVQQKMSTLQPGDQVLFQRGGVYPGQLDIFANGTAAAPIVFGAYGTGERPIISGGEPITGWVQYQGHIWRAPVSTAPKYLLVNNEPMTLARYPNTGWLRNVQGSTTQINTGGALTQSSGYWNGATLVVRSTNWCYETSTITGYNNGTLTFQPITSSLNNNDWGFFLCNKLSELDMPGEWYYDATAGQVYLWAPGNANPNTISVLGSVYAKGFVPGWQKHHMRIEELCFQGQKEAGISTEVSNNVTVTNCTFRHLYKAISSSGTNNSYTYNTIYDTYATAVNIYDDNVLIANNTLTDIALRPGLGESVWGHMGINTTGMNTIIRENRLENIGYIGIVAGKNALIERNVVHNATSILNDGGGIAFDHADGMIVRDNIVTDVVGNLESVATNYVSYYPICMGIYFGNTSIKNTTVERNTVARCSRAGIHVDHTMVSVNNVIRDNVLFDNHIQLSVSDFSNNNGPGATPPFHVPSFNDVYSGNILYSIRPEQLCMNQYNVYSPNPVDFGTFTNNRYFNPYNELSIHVHNTNSGVQTTYTLEQWQTLRGEDAGSTRSPLRLSNYQVQHVFGNNMIPNGTFNGNVSGWTGWPDEAQRTFDPAQLDNGAMKVLFNNNSTYNIHFLYPNAMGTVQNGQWYRLRFSTVSTMSGTLQIEVKGASQMSGPYAMYTKKVPFSAERRDMELFFQSDRSEDVRCQFINAYTESTYWLDNVELHRVEVNEIDPYIRHTLLLNDQATAQSFNLTGCWRDANGALYSGEVVVQAFSSIALTKEETDDACTMTTGTDGMPTADADMLGVHPNPATAGTTVMLGTRVERPMTAMLFDAAGRTVQTTTLAVGADRLQLGGGLRPGAYSLVLSGENTVLRSRLVVAATL
jgi:hypothetical protein